MTLTGKQRRFLRSQGHHLNAVVQIGKHGISQAFLEAVDQALLDHELIKLRVGQNAVMEPGAAATEIARATGSEVAQVLGSTVLLYRPHPEKPRLRLP